MSATTSLRPFGMFCELCNFRQSIISGFRTSDMGCLRYDGGISVNSFSFSSSNHGLGIKHQIATFVALHLCNTKLASYQSSFTSNLSSLRCYRDSYNHYGSPGPDKQLSLIGDRENLKEFHIQVRILYLVGGTWIVQRLEDAARAVFNEDTTVEWEEPFEVAALWSARMATMALLAKLQRPLTLRKCSCWSKSSSSTIKRPRETVTLLLGH